MYTADFCKGNRAVIVYMRYEKTDFVHVSAEKNLYRRIGIDYTYDVAGRVSPDLVGKAVGVLDYIHLIGFFKAAYRRCREQPVQKFLVHVCPP